MNNLMRRTRKVKFDIEVEIKKLLDIPQKAGGQIYVKLKCEKGKTVKNFHHQRTNSASIREHTATWNEVFTATGVPIPIDPHNNTLHPVVLRLSIRQETKGGKGFSRMGLVMLNLSEYAGHRVNTSMFALKESRLNSRLQITTRMVLVDGDPLFRPNGETDGTLDDVPADAKPNQGEKPFNAPAAGPGAGPLGRGDDHDLLLNTFLDAGQGTEQKDKDIIGRLMATVPLINSHVVYSESLRLPIERSRFGVFDVVEQILERHTDSNVKESTANPMSAVNFG